MNILYIWDADYPWDIRVEKICKSLAAAGHDTHIAARNLKRSPPFENVGGLKVHRLRPRRNARINYVLSFPAFFSPIWLAHLRRIVREAAIELIIVRDLPMAIAGIWTGRHAGIPVIFDMAEDYVSMLQAAWDDGAGKGLNRFVRNPRFARRVEAYALPRFQHTLVVVEEMIEVAVAAGCRREDVSIVSNTPTRATLESTAGLAGTSAAGDAFTAIYTGGLEFMRGLHVVLDAIPAIRERIAGFRFRVAGAGAGLEDLRAHAARIGVEDSVEWLGWVEHARLFELIGASDAGIIPHRVSRHVDTTVPNKLFDYMACGIPVVASDARPMKRILESSGAGLTFRDRDPSDLARAVIEVHESNLPFGRNGRRAVETQYSWPHDEARLLSAVERFVR